jgi:hypothetical protein
MTCMGKRIACVALALIATGGAGCSILGNVYSTQNHIACPPMTEDELRAELRGDADVISRLVGQKVYVQVDDGERFILNVRIPNKKPATFWYVPQPVDIRMSTEPGGLFIAVHKADDAQEDETTRQAQDAVEKTVAASRCRLDNSYLSRFDMI